MRIIVNVAGEKNGPHNIQNTRIDICVIHSVLMANWESLGYRRCDTRTSDYNVLSNRYTRGGRKMRDYVVYIESGIILEAKNEEDAIKKAKIRLIEDPVLELGEAAFRAEKWVP
jgi:hypothetical protein